MMNRYTTFGIRFSWALCLMLTLGIAPVLAQAPDINLSTATLGFPNTEAGQTSAEQTVTIENTGDADLTISAITLAGATPEAFAILNAADCTSGVIAAGSSCELRLTFSPQVAGASAAVVEITSDDPDESLLRVQVTGIGTGAPATASRISLTPIVINFAVTESGTESAAQSITVENTGTSDLAVTRIRLIDRDKNEFTLSGSDACIKTYAAGETCTFEATFKPTRAGSKAAKVEVRSDDRQNPRASVAVTGIATPPAGTTTPEVSVTPALVAFDATVVGEESPVQNVVIQNVGGADLRVQSLNLQNRHSRDFVITDRGACANNNTDLAPGASCTIQLTFKPRRAGTRIADLRIRTNDADERTLLVRLNGIGIEPTGTTPEISVTPLGLSYSGVGVNTESAAEVVTVENVGADGLRISQVRIRGAAANQFAIDTNGCRSANLANDEQCQIAVKFTPTAAGAHVATLRISSNDADNRTVFVQLAGVASTTGPGVPDITPSSAALNFGFSERNVETDAQTFRLTNDGSGDLDITRIRKRGANANSFNLSQDCTRNDLAQGEFCTISVTFRPRAEVAQIATVEIRSNDPDEGNLILTVVGYGTPRSTPPPAPPEITVDPLIVDFSSDPAARLDVTITNEGTGRLNFDSIAVDVEANFEIVSNNCGNRRNAGSSCRVRLRYTGDNTSAESATLDIASDDADEPLVRVLLATTGAPAVAPLNAELNGGGGNKNATGTTQMITITNPGTEAFAFLNLSLNGPDAEAFSVETSTCGDVLEPSESCEVEVAFTGALEDSQFAIFSVVTDNMPFTSTDVQLVTRGEVQTSVTVEDAEMPTSFRLEQNYPNPFNPVTTIAYEVPTAGAVRLAVYDMLGREVAILADSHVTAGAYTVTFDAANLSSGMYLYRLETDQRVLTQRMTLLK